VGCHRLLSVLLLSTRSFQRCAGRRVGPRNGLVLASYKKIFLASGGAAQAAGPILKTLAVQVGWARVPFTGTSAWTYFLPPQTTIYGSQHASAAPAMRRRPSQTRFAVSLSFVGWPSCRLLAWLSLACYRWLQGHAAGSVMDGRASGLGFWIHFMDGRASGLGFWIHFSLVGPFARHCCGWMLCLGSCTRVHMCRRWHLELRRAFVRLRAPRCSGHPRSWMPRLDALPRQLHACARATEATSGHPRSWMPRLDALPRQLHACARASEPPFCRAALTRAATSTAGSCASRQARPAICGRRAWLGRPLVLSGQACLLDVLLLLLLRQLMCDTVYALSPNSLVPCTCEKESSQRACAARARRLLARCAAAALAAPADVRHRLRAVAWLVRAVHV